MSKGKARAGLALLVMAFGCSSSNSEGPGGFPGAAGHGGSPSPTSGHGGSPGVPGGPPSATGAGGTGPTAGAGGMSTGGTGPIAGAGGAAGSGAGGAGGGTACAGDPLTRCTGTMSGPWCSEQVSVGALPHMDGIWANSPDNVWFVGGQFPPGGITAFGLIARFDGCAWTVTPRPDLPELHAVWGAAPNDVWLAGANGTAYHWNGTTLTAVPVPGATMLKSVSGTSGTDAWAVGTAIYHWDGSAWTQSFASPGNDVWAVSPTDVWVASGTTDALHFDGTAWTTTTLTDFGLFTIWGDGTQAYAGGEGEALFRFVGGSWTTLAVRGGSSEGFVDIGGLGADIFTVGNNQVVQLSGNTFTPVTDVPFGSYRSVWVSPTQVWFGDSSGLVTHRAR
jgi:hypothetical protein